MNGKRNESPLPSEEGRAWIDDRGWKYRVRSGIGGDAWKGFFQKDIHSGSAGWHAVRSLPWVSDVEKAQADLDAYAVRKGMEPWDETM